MWLTGAPAEVPKVAHSGIGANRPEGPGAPLTGFLGQHRERSVQRGRPYRNQFEPVDQGSGDR